MNSPVPLFSAVIAACVGVLALRSDAPLLVITAGAVAILILVLHWRPGDLPLLALPLSFQWSEVAMKPLQSAILGQPLNRLSDFSNDLAPAAYLGLGGIAALAVGLFLGAGTRSIGNRATFELSRMSMREIVVICFGALLIGHALEYASNYAGGARQIFLAMSGIRHVGLFVLGYWCMTRRKGLALLVIVYGGEIILGMTGFFADYKNTLLVLVAAVLSGRPKFGLGDLAVFGSVAVIVVGTAAFWSEIKPGYRDFLNAGTGRQEVVQPLGDRLSYLVNAFGKFDSKQLANGMDRLAQRQSYIDYLAATMKNVPSRIPHQNGAQLGQALVHIVTPRVFFPDKADTPHDSAITAYYTGMPISGGDTSISLGYVAELYVDFGIAGAMACCFLLGLMYGSAYAHIRDHKKSPALLCAGICLLVALPLATFGTALIKLLGAAAMTMACGIFLQQVILPRILARRAPPAPGATIIN